MAAPVLQIDELTVHFDGAGAECAVDHVDLRVEAGEIVALVGESGSGKSITARAVLGLLPDSARASGSIRLDGQEVLGQPDAVLRGLRGAKVAMVFQEPSTALNPVERIGWQIAEALRAHGKVSRSAARRRALELLRAVEIPEPEVRIDHYPHQLSGGQKQRVVIALALANEPDLIIADEPTTALDVTVQAEILALLRDIRDRSGRAVLVITHNMGVVADLADRVVVMRNGSVVESGDALRVFERPRADYTRELLAAVPQLPVDPPALQPVHGTDERVLEFDDVVVEYPGVHGRAAYTAVDGVTLAVHRGEVVGLVGESGSGKSTLGRAAIGLLRHRSGHARLFDVELGEASSPVLRYLRRRVGVVFQDPAATLDPLRTVGDAVGEPLRVHDLLDRRGVDARVAEMLEAVRLPAAFATRMPAELSGGQRQRVGLARALVRRPDLVIADEPTSALDVSVQAEVLELFGELRRELDFGCLFISHDLAVVDEVADSVAVLRAGELVELGHPGTVLRRPSSDYTRALIDAVPIPDPVRQRERRHLLRAG